MKTIAASELLGVARLIKSASDDQTRHTLQSVYFNRELRTCEASTGYALATHKLSDEVFEFLNTFPGIVRLSVAFCTSLLKLKNKDMRGAFVTAEGNLIGIKAGDSTLQFVVTSEAFPDTRQITPKFDNDGQYFSIGLNVKYLLELYQAMKGDSRLTTVTLTFKNDFNREEPWPCNKSAIRVSVGKDSGVLMPVRLDSEYHTKFKQAAEVTA